MIDNKFILRQKRNTNESSFSLTDIVGKTIIESRKIKNPGRDNPEFLNVMLFSDDTFLVTELIGDGENSTLHAYFYDGQKTRYSDRLFY